MTNVRLYDDTGIGNQIQFIPAIKTLAKHGFNIHTNSQVYHGLIPELVNPPQQDKVNDVGILLYHQGLPIGWRAKKECKKVIGFPYSFKFSGHREVPVLSRVFLSNKTKFDSRIPEIQNNMNLISYFGIKDIAIDFTLDIPLSPDKNVIGLSAGSGGHPQKRWKHWAGLIALLPEKRFKLFGTETELNKRIKKDSDPNRVTIVETDSIKSAASEIAKCEMFIANDNGLMHLADLLQVPLIAIFGMTNLKRNGPWHDSSSVITLNLPCSPCYRNGQIYCIFEGNEKYKCLHIPAEIISSKVKEKEKAIL